MPKPMPLLKIVNFMRNNEELYRLFRYNLMTKNIEFTRKSTIGIHGKFLIGEDIIDLKYYMAVIAEEEFNIARIEEAVLIASKNMAYNPLTDYLNSLVWDKIERVDTWLIDFFGAEDNIYTRNVARKVLCGAVARALDPGVKFDHMLILEGIQGVGKSTLIEALAGEWYLDTALSGTDNKKDLIDLIRTAWIVEIGDMAGFKKHDVDYLKAFLSRKVDRVRLPYGRRSQDFPRQCVFIGTLNPSGHNEYLKDDTGNRRFWIIECSKADYKKIPQIRDQLFAEAIVKYKEGEPLFLDNKEALDILLGLQEERESSNPLDRKIKAFTMMKDRVDKYELLDIIYDGKNLNTIGPSDLRGKETLIGTWFRKNGWVRGRGKNKSYYYISDGERHKDENNELWEE